MIFGANHHGGRTSDLPLSEFPAWGLEFMMGLYGPDTIRRACADERADGRLQRRRLVAATFGSGAVVEDAPGEPAPTAHRPETESVADATPLVLELEAMNALVRYLEKRFRRH